MNNQKEITVAGLIEILKAMPQDLTVVFPLHSEYKILERIDISVESLCEPRNDGWVALKRPDKPTREYVSIG